MYCFSGKPVLSTNISNQQLIMGVSSTKPSIASRIQQHLSTFDFCLQQGDYATAKLKGLMMNMDLEPEMQVKIGHGIDINTVTKQAKIDDDFSKAKLLDDHCKECKESNDVCHIHPPQEIYDARDKNNRVGIEMAWLTEFMLLVENQIRVVGYAKGWWAE